MGAWFFRLRNQNFTLIGIREKMENLGEKMKTHVSKISLGSRARKLALEEVEESQGFLDVKHSKYQKKIHHVFSQSRSFWNYLHFSNWMSRNQDIWI